MENKDLPFKQHCETAHFSRNNSEGLRDLNTAINALYAIESGALSANTLNTPTYVSEVVQHLKIDVAEWANKLGMMRNLLYGEDLDWEHIQKQLEAIPDKSGNGGGFDDSEEADP